MHQYRAPFRELDTFFAVRSWVDCITNMSGFDLRQAQAAFAARWSGASDRGAQFGGEEARARDRPARTQRLQAAFALAVPRHQDRIVHRWPVDVAAGKLDDMAHAGAL